MPLKNSGFMCSLCSVLYFFKYIIICLLIHLTFIEYLRGAYYWAVHSTESTLNELTV